MSDIKNRTLKALARVTPGKDWTQVEGLPDDFYGPWQCGGWMKLVDNKKVAVILSHQGKHHPSWKLVVNGRVVREMSEIDCQMGSGRDAQCIADVEIHKWN